MYGDADLSEHSQMVSILKAGGDPGQLAIPFTLAINLVTVAGQGLISGARRLAGATSPGSMAAAGFAPAIWYARPPGRASQRVATAGRAILMSAAGAVTIYDASRRVWQGSGTV